jgi:hypothetical protein
MRSSRGRPRLWMGFLLGLLSCTCARSIPHAQRFDEPVSTLETLQGAIREARWAEASECFSREIREANAAAIGTEAFYATDYWTETRTVQVLLGPLPILAESARFEVISRDAHRAEVRISYPERREKDMRPQRIGLVREQDGSWKVADVYGQVRGGATSPAGQ